MPLYPVDAPTQLAVSLDDVKDYLRVDHNDEDDTIEALIAAVVAHLDGRDGWLGRALVSQTWDYKVEEFCGNEVRIPLPPLIEVVDTITYYDRDNALQTLDDDVYEVIGIGGRDKARVVLKYGQRWPVTYRRAEAAIIRFTAGYVDTGSSPPSGDVPAPIVTAIKRLVATLYDVRETIIVGQTPIVVPLKIEALLAPYRVWP